MADAPTYCRVLPTFWTDPKVKRKLTLSQKHLLLYLFTSPHTNMIGLYYLPLAYAESEAEIPRAQIDEYLRGPLAPFATYDAETEEVLVHRAARHNIGEELSEKDNRAKAVQRLLRDAHSPRLVAMFTQLYSHWPLPSSPPVENASPEGDVSPLVSPSEALAVTEHEQGHKQEGSSAAIAAGAGAPEVFPHRAAQNRLMGIVRECLYVNGRPPRKRTDADDANTILTLLERGTTAERIEQAIRGVAALRDDGELEFVKSGDPMSTGALVFERGNDGWHPQPMFQRAIDYYHKKLERSPATGPRKLTVRVG